MRIGIVKEVMAGERCVAATPKSVVSLIKLGFDVSIEAGAGLGSQFDDAAYRAAGATVVEGDALYDDCDILYQINPPNDAEISKIKAGTILVCFIWPRQNTALLEKLAARKITVLAMDMVPRISRAQSLDALSSMANISGYRAVLEAANEFDRFFAGQITAAGKIPPAQVLVIGAGVAGLAAIGTATSLGAVVKAFDTRAEVAEQIASMGGEFLPLDFEEKADNGVDTGYAKVMSKAYIEAEMKLFLEQAKQVDIIITTAAIPGKPAPKLITREMVACMKRGSVIVDMAAATGGNCELTVVGEKSVTDNGVIILGYTDLATRLSGQSSQLYATNLANLTKLLAPQKNGIATVNFDDVILRTMTVIKAGELTFPPPEVAVSASPKLNATPDKKTAPVIEKKPPNKAAKAIFGLGVVLLGILLTYAPQPFLTHMMVLVLSVVIGYYVIWNVSHSLHTPLMSVTNAISGIIVVGAILQIGHGNGWVSFLAFFAILLASINIFGGFAVTHRMLQMFRKD